MFPGDARLDHSGNDPFVTTEEEIKNLDRKLSPEAPAFKPLAFRVPTKTIDNDGNVRVNYPEDPGKSYTASPSGAHVPAITSKGCFSTDTQVTRLVKLTGIHSEVDSTEVEKTLQVCHS